MRQKSDRALPLPGPTGARQLDRQRSRAKSGSRLEEVLNSAAKIFFSKGFHGTTIEDVARDVGMLKGSLYYYIKSKEDLLYRILCTVIEQGDAHIAKHIGPAGDSVVHLKRAIEAQIDYIIENRVRVGLFLHEFETLSGKRRQKVVALMTRYNNRFVEIVRRGQAQGKFADGDPVLIVNGFLGMINWIYRWFHAGDPTEPEEIKRIFVRMIMKGLAKD